jgi:hypothetical protein
MFRIENVYIHFWQQNYEIICIFQNYFVNLQINNT